MINNYLTQKALVENISTLSELEESMKKDSLNIMMGQTFDNGQPVDMMKYALFMMNISDILKEKEVVTKSNWLIADHFIAEINQDKTVAEVTTQMESRIKYLNKLNEVYGGNIGFVKSSELSKTKEYQANLDRLFVEAEKNPRFKELVLNAIPADRRSNPNALRYPFEELATIQSMHTDIKIGPPYEKVYDTPAREYAAEVGFTKYIAIQLTKSFPLGNPEIPSKLREEIETFGILPYKKDSKGLGNYRIDPINDDLNKVKQIINETTDVRSIVDLLIITEQAKCRLENNITESFFAQKGQDMIDLKYNVTEDDPRILGNQWIGYLKDLAIGSYTKFIHEPLNKTI